MEKNYIKSKHNNEYDNVALRYYVRVLKDAQKCLEYIRKDYPFEYNIDENILPFIPIQWQEQKHIVKVFGRDTWRKVNRMFESEISNELFTKWEKEFLRQSKLKRTLKNNYGQ